MTKVAQKGQGESSFTNNKKKKKTKSTAGSFYLNPTELFGL